MTIHESSTKITDGGRIVIPSLFRKELNLQIGDEVILLLEDGEFRVLSQQAASKRAQTLVKTYAQERNLADELIAERRAEVINE